MREKLYRAPTYYERVWGFAPTLRLSRGETRRAEMGGVEPAALPPVGRRKRALAGASEVGAIDETEAVTKQ